MKKMIAMLLAGMMAAGSFTTTAFAYTGETVETTAETDAGVQASVSETGTNAEETKAETKTEGKTRGKETAKLERMKTTLLIPICRFCRMAMR